MKKVAIVGVEGSGKTVMLAGLGELYSKPDEQGYFLSPKNFATASYVADKIARMRQGEWPTATAEDVLQGLDWSIRRKGEGATRPQDVCEVSCLDFAGEVYRAAFGIRAESAEDLSSEAESLKAYVQNADDVIVLINLRDIIVNGIRDKRVQESLWITKSILQYALESRSGRKEPRAALVLTQADSYADTIRACGGAKGVLEEYLRDVANNYGWLDVFAVSAVDKTSLDADGNLVPAADFQPVGLKPLVRWILDGSKAVATGGGSKTKSEANSGGRREVPSKATPTRDVPKKVNILSFLLALGVAGFMSLVCFADGHWCVGGMLAFLCLVTLGARGDKDWRQGAGWWFLYTVILFVGGVIGLADLGWVSLIALFLDIGLLYKDEKK